MLFEDDFNALDLNNWIPFGSPSPRVLASVVGRNGIFDNNGDSWCNSGVVSKDTFSVSNGFSMESDVYVSVTNIAGCWDEACIGLTKENTPYMDHPNCPGQGYYTGLIFGIFYAGDACWATPPELRRHAYFRISLYAEDETGEGPGYYAINADDFINEWHTLKIVVDEDRFVSFYCDDNLLYKSEKRIHEDILQDKKIYLGQRSSGSAGKAYHDYIKITVQTGQPAIVTIKPETLNLNSKGLFTTFIKFPEGHDVADINVSTVTCEGAPAIRGMVSEVDNGTYIAKFNRQDLVNVTSGDATLTVTGELYDGAQFEGNDTIRVID